MKSKEFIYDEYITVSLIGSGFAALHIVRIEDETLGRYDDVQDTGFGRYETREEAEIEAKGWAKEEGLEFRK